MAYLYLKALHIIFVVTWFAGLFYIPRLFIYNTEAQQKDEAVRNALQDQFGIMIKRLWYGITWPSAILTLVLGITVLFKGGWNLTLMNTAGQWLLIKLVFVVFLYIYHYTLHRMVLQELRGEFRYSSMQLRIWNEVATVILIAVVMLATVKQSISLIWGLVGLIAFMALLMSAIRIYKILREKKS